MAQNENYNQVDLRIGTEEQFNAKVGTLPAGTLFGITDSTVSKADLSTDLKNEINGKYTKPADGIPKTDLASDVQTSLGKADTALQTHQSVKLESGTNNGTLKLTVNGTATDNVAVTNLGSAAFTAASNYAAAAQGAKADSAIQKPSNPSTESAITINSSGTISTKPLSSITGKTEVYVGTPDPTGSEILWIDPDGKSGTSIASKAIMLCSNNGNVKLNAGSNDEYILPTTEAGVPKFKLGSGNFKFEEIWSKTFNGDLDGTATRAFKADAVKTEADYRGYSPYKTIVRGLYACILRTQASEYQTVMLSIVDLNVDTYGRGAYYDGKTNEGVQYNGTSHQIRSTNEEALTLVEVRLITSY